MFSRSFPASKKWQRKRNAISVLERQGPLGWAQRGVSDRKGPTRRGSGRHRDHPAGHGASRLPFTGTRFMPVAHSVWRTSSEVT